MTFAGWLTIILFAGIGDGMKVLVIFFGCLWPVLLNTVEGVRAIDPVLRDSARSYGFGPYCRLRRLILPAASPRIPPSKAVATGALSWSSAVRARFTASGQAARC